MAQKYKALSDAMDYFEEIGQKLYELEQAVKDIKNSDEFKKHANTMRVYANRRLIDSCPAYKNGYSLPTEIVLEDGVQNIKDFFQNNLDKKDKL